MSSISNPPLTTRQVGWLLLSLAAILLAVITVVHIQRADLRRQTYIVNFSARARVGIGTNVLVAGLVVKDQPQTVLIRVLGPSLRAYGVADALADPVVQVVHQGSGKEVGRNDNWQEARQPRFAGDLREHRPKDRHECLLLLRLEPGSYSVVVEGVKRSEGVALLEVFRIMERD